MSEQAQVVVPEVTANPFSGSWSETPVETAQVETPVVETPAAPVVETPVVETPVVEEPKVEVFDSKNWLTQEFGIDDPAVLKAEREELKRLKQEKLPELDEQGKHMYELVREGRGKELKNFLETQEKLESYLLNEVTKDNAADIIKLGMELKFKHLNLSETEINYKYNKDFGIPKEPVQFDSELDEEFAARKNEWADRVSDIEMQKVIEAKLIKPELEKAKANLVLPELTKPVAAVQEVSEPDPAKLKEVRDNFLAQLESNYSKVEGFETRVKDESVDIPVAFKIPDEEKVAIKERLKEGFDVNSYIDSRWFDQSGSPKIEQIVKDIYQLENLEKVLSGVSNNAAALRLKEFQKQAKNIDVNGNTAQQTFNPSQNGQQSVNPFSKNAWSEQPVTLTN